MGSTPTLFRHPHLANLHEVAPMLAYEIEVMKRGVDRADPEDAGWCFGLPPGIRPEQWPLDPDSGYPLAHAFTLLLPEDYRRHGPDLVAVSLFGTPIDINQGVVPRQDDIAAASAPGAPEPTDPDLLPFWRAARSGHPTLVRSRDIFEVSYAALMLTRAEFEGDLCPPPDVAPNPYRDQRRRPLWLSMGSAAAFVRHGHDQQVSSDIGTVPEGDTTCDRALRLRPDPGDPNGGKAPCEPHDEVQTGYIDPYVWHDDGELTYHPWAEGLTWNRVGGTIRPCQNQRPLSPYHIEFEEYVGGFDFGLGTGMLDLADLTCGFCRG